MLKELADQHQKEISIQYFIGTICYGGQKSLYIGRNTLGELIFTKDEQILNTSDRLQLEYDPYQRLMCDLSEYIELHPVVLSEAGKIVQESDLFAERRKKPYVNLHIRNLPIDSSKTNSDSLPISIPVSDFVRSFFPDGKRLFSLSGMPFFVIPDPKFPGKGYLCAITPGIPHEEYLKGVRINGSALLSNTCQSVVDYITTHGDKGIKRYMRLAELFSSVELIQKPLMALRAAAIKLARDEGKLTFTEAIKLLLVDKTISDLDARQISGKAPTTERTVDDKSIKPQRVIREVDVPTTIVTRKPINRIGFSSGWVSIEKLLEQQKFNSEKSFLSRDGKFVETTYHDGSIGVDIFDLDGSKLRKDIVLPESLVKLTSQGNLVIFFDEGHKVRLSEPNKFAWRGGRYDYSLPGIDNLAIGEVEHLTGDKNNVYFTCPVYHNSRMSQMGFSTGYALYKFSLEKNPKGERLSLISVLSSIDPQLVFRAFQCISPAEDFVQVFGFWQGNFLGMQRLNVNHYTEDDKRRVLVVGNEKWGEIFDITTSRSGTISAATGVHIGEPDKRKIVFFDSTTGRQKINTIILPDIKDANYQGAKLALSPDGKYCVVVYNYIKTIKRNSFKTTDWLVIDTQTGQIVRTFDPPQEYDPNKHQESEFYSYVTQMQWHESEDQLLVCLDDGTLRIF